MIFDKLLMFFEVQVVMVIVVFIDVIDLVFVDGICCDIGVGYLLEFWVFVNIMVIVVGVVIVNVQLQISFDNSIWMIIYDSGVLVLVVFKVGKCVVLVKVLVGVQCYLCVNYFVVIGLLIVGVFIFGINLDVDMNILYLICFKVIG